jgi:hypothetical protein
MRSSFGSARGALLVPFLFLAACSARRVPPAPATDPAVVLEGVIAIAGLGTFDRDVVLYDEGGPICRLTGGSAELELRNLAGLGVRVTGRLAGRTNDIPEFLIDRWELLPVDGREPVVGVIESRNGVPYLVVERNAFEYRLGGPLAGALEPLSGFKVWVAGEERPAGEEGARERTLAVASYGVLLPPRSLNRAP